MNFDQLTNYFNRAIKPIKDRVVLMINRGVISQTNSAKDVTQSQISLLAGESMDQVELFQHFGFTSNPPEGTECVAIAIGSNRENLVIIATENRSLRMKGLAKGETAIYTADGTLIHLQVGGQVLVKTATKVTIDAPDAEFTGNVKVVGTMLVQEDATFEKNIEVTENATVNGIAMVGGITGLAGGNVESTVDFNTSGDVVADGVSLKDVRDKFNAHVHSNPEGGSVGPATPQI